MLELVVKAAVVPFAGALVLSAGLGRFYRSGWGWSCRVFGPALAFFGAMLLLHGQDAVVPKRPWQWLGWLGIAGAVAGAIGTLRGARWNARATLHVILAVLAAWVLVPGWKEMAPVRGWYVAGFAAYLTMLLSGVTELPRWERGKGIVLGITGLVLAGLCGAGVSVTYGLMAGAGAMSLMGLACAGVSERDRGVGVVYGVLIGGMALWGWLEPRPAVPGFLVLAASPLALWLGELSVLRKVQGIRGTVLRGLPWLMVLGAGAAWVVMGAGMLSGY